MRLITVKMPEIYVNGIEELVKAGRYSSRSEVIRIAVRELLKRELWGATVPVAERPRMVGIAPVDLGIGEEEIPGATSIELDYAYT